MTRVPFILAGVGTFYTKEEALAGSGGFSADDQMPGDQIRFSNPYFDSLSKAEQDKHPGEEGSNVFYLGTNAQGQGLVMDIYAGKVMTFDEKRQVMLAFPSAQIGSAGDAVAEDFQATKLYRPIVGAMK